MSSSPTNPVATPTPARILIAGTAGHIDHGKSTLVRALTGTDPDRLKEEKERGITIDLGFATSLLPNHITLSWIDVPGHERFVGNMLAGVAGIDLSVLVVAANEGVMPQTEEHFHICRLLGIRHGLVALTKIDLADAQDLSLARAQIASLVRGSFLQDAPVIPLSAQTGEGLEELQVALGALCEAIPQRSYRSLFRMPVDRVFTMKGFGVVATGTIFDGCVRKDDEITLLPSARTLRVRGLQQHGETVSVAQAGQRAAINLVGAEVSDVSRGDMLVQPDALQSTTGIDAEFRLIDAAPPLPTLSPIHFHAGAKQCVGRIRLHDERRVLQPGESAFVHIRLQEEMVLLPGDRFIVRRFSPLETLGGGRVLDNQPPRMRRKQRAETRLSRLASASFEQMLPVLVDEFPFGCEARALVSRVGLSTSEVLSAAQRVGLRVVGAGRDVLIGQAALETVADAIQAFLSSFHQQHPMLPGAPRQVLRSDLPLQAPPALVDWIIGNDPRFHAEKEFVRLKQHEPSLNAPEAEAARRIERAFLDAGFEVPSVEEVLAATGIEAARSRTILQLLIREGKLVRVGPSLVYHKQILGNAVRLLTLRRGQRFGVAQFKEWTGVSRKYAIPLLEFLDRQRITRRDGNERIVL